MTIARPTRSFGILLLLLFGHTAIARGAVCKRLDLESLVRHSAVIVQGKVLGSRCEIDPSGRRLTTVTRLRVSTSFKGPTGSVVEVRSPGGRLGRLVQVVSGSTRFVKGETVFLFLWRSRKGTLTPLGLSQGKFQGRRNRKGVLSFVRDLGGISFVDGATGRLDRRKSTIPRKLPAKTLARNVQECVARQVTASRKKTQAGRQK
jgi:hypothetical protein